MRFGDSLMKIAKLFSLFALLLLAASLASAQVTVDPNNDSCWQEISSLRACQAAQLRLQESQVQRCTSFPEYQCAPEEQPATAPTKMQGLKSKGNDVTSGVAAFQANGPSSLLRGRIQGSRGAAAQHSNSR